MNRRRFLQNLAVTSAGAQYLTGNRTLAEPMSSPENDLGADLRSDSTTVSTADIDGHTLLAQFTLGSATWKAYEDLRTRDGVVTFVSSGGDVRILAKSVEATFSDVEPPYLGLSLDDIGVSGPDLLADRLLEGGGDPDPERVKSAAPPLESRITSREGWGERLPWNTFVGTKECFDTMPVTPRGSTRTYHPEQHFQN